ncbi:MAG TPA: hypothetical protein PLO51_02300 [Candidatus Micrarchaeota archaeon]|nr:hypothetical protein [Candidatus Micrarchaeota archaeon]
MLKNGLGGKSLTEAQAALQSKLSKMMPMLDGQLHKGPWLCESHAAKVYSRAASDLRQAEPSAIRRKEVRAANNRTVIYYNVSDLERQFTDFSMGQSNVATIISMLASFQNSNELIVGAKACIARTASIFQNNFVFKILPSLLEAFQDTFKADAPSALLATAMLKAPESQGKGRALARQDWGTIAKEALDCCAKLVPPFVVDVGAELEYIGFEHALTVPALPEKQIWQKNYIDSEGGDIQVWAYYELVGKNEKAWQIMSPDSLTNMESSDFVELDRIQKMLSGKSISVAEFYDSMHFRLKSAPPPKPA